MISNIYDLSDKMHYPGHCSKNDMRDKYMVLPLF